MINRKQLFYLVIAAAALVMLFAAQSAGASDGLPDVVPNPRTVEVGPPLGCEQIEAIVSNPQDWFIIDARSTSEYDDAHVSTAVNIPYDSLRFYLDELPADKDAAIVTYCRSGGRATVLKGMLETLGYSNVSVVPGSQMDRSNPEQLSFRCGD